MNKGNQASTFAGENSYFQPPKTENSPKQKSNTGESYPLAQVIEDYKLRGKVEGRAEKTLEQYDYVLGRLTEKFNKNVEVDSIETREIRNYLAYLMSDGLSNTTVAMTLASSRATRPGEERDSTDTKLEARSAAP